MKIVIGMTIGDPFDEFLEGLRDTWPDVEFVVAKSEEEQLKEVGDAEAYVGLPSSKVFAAAKQLKWIHAPSTGINWIMDKQEVIDSDVILTNSRGPHATSMADHVIGVMITFAHHMVELWDDQRAGVWDTAKYVEREYEELAGRTCGILALGDLGKAIARRAYGADMDVCAVDIRPVDPIPEVKEVWGLDRLDDLMKLSDWLIVTAPLTRDSKDMIGARELALMKPTARVIIISRGGIVNEDALIDALRNKTIAGAGIDAFVTEPLPADSPFWTLDNVLLSPHASGITPEMWEGRRDILRENLRRYIDGLQMLDVCDKEAGF